MSKLRLKGINNWTKVLPTEKGQSLNLNPHLTVEKFEAVRWMTVLGLLTGKLQEVLHTYLSDSMYQFSLSSQSLCHFRRHLCYSRRAENTMQYWWAILHPLFFWVWRDPDLGLGSLGSPIKFSVSRLTRLTRCHVYLLHRALSVPELLSAQRGNVENRAPLSTFGAPLASPAIRGIAFPQPQAREPSVTFIFLWPFCTWNQC